MTTRILLLCWLGLALPVFADPPTKEKESPIIKELQGKWVVVQIERQKDPPSPETLKQMNLTISFDGQHAHMKVTGHDDTRMRLNAQLKKTPHELDLQEIDEKGQPNAVRRIDLGPGEKPKFISEPVGPRLAIWEIEGDKFRLCWNRPDGVRPKSFAAWKEDSGIVLMTLKRLKD